MNKFINPESLSFFKPANFLPVPITLLESNIQAGFPSPADDYAEAKLDLNQALITHPAATFFVKVTGKSMTGIGISPGDILIVDRSIEASDGKIIIAVIDGEFTVKRLSLNSEGVCLLSENPVFAPIKIHSEANFQVWGVVTYVIHDVRNC
jgi:DNA polymerase V